MFLAAIKPRDWAFLTLFLLVILLFRLGRSGLEEPDEGRYATIAQEAMEPGHSWLEPHMLELGHYDKPPLIYGVTDLSFRIFGLNEWAARIPSLLGGLFTLIGIGWAAGRLYGARTAWLTVLMAGTFFHIWALARFLSPDMFLTGWCTLAVAAWVETQFRRGAWRWWSLQVLFWTLALWTKATPALVPLLGLSVYVYWLGGPSARRALKLPLLLPSILFLSAIWFFAVIHRHPELQDFFLHRETMARLTGHIEGRRLPPYYYLLTSLAAWLPWWPLALAALYRQRKIIRKRLPDWKNECGPEFFIFAIGFIVFSIVPSKLYTYTLPLAPWVALLMARLLISDAVLCTAPVLAAFVGIATMAYATITFSIPRYESDLSRNSSLREAADFLCQHHATGIHADHLWPSLDFYWHGDFHFTGVVVPLEVRESSDKPTAHFEAALPAPLPSGDWFIHFRKQDETPFRPWLEDSKIPKTVIGDFVVGPLSAEPIKP